MRNKTTAATLIVLVALAGAVLGAVGDRMWLMHCGRLQHPRGGPSVDRMLNHLDHELQLSPEQKKQITSILNRRKQTMDSIWDSVRPRIRAEADGTGAEIEKVLTPEQRPKFAAMRERFRAHGIDHHSFGPRP